MNILKGTQAEMQAGRFHADQIVMHASAAYWLEGRDDETAAYLREQVHASFAKLADALGYDIAARVPADPIDEVGG